MVTPPRMGNPLIGYTALIAGTCTACHFLLTATASHYMSAPMQAAAAKPQPGHSRVEGWMRRQTMANLKKKALPMQAAERSAAILPSSAPYRDVAHAVVMAAAIDNAERSIEAPAAVPSVAIETRALLLRRRFRTPSCYELPCERNLNEALLTSESQMLAAPAAKTNALRTATQSSTKAISRNAKAAGGKIAASLETKRKAGAARTKVQSKLAHLSRAQAKKKIALKRFKETPSEISYRSFVGTFVPAI